MKEYKEIQVALLGLGTVGLGVYKVLQMQKEEMQHKIGTEVKIKKILVRNLEKAASKIEDPSVLTNDWQEIVNDDEIQIVIEVMGGMELARTYIMEAMQAGKQVVTANKDLIAADGRELMDQAKKSGCDLLFEAAVAGAIPIIRPLNSSLTADRIDEVIGILNGTTNYMMTKMFFEGADYAEVLKEAQDKGYAERNPEADVEGHDACRKIAILTSLISGQHVDFEKIHTEGITKITTEDMKYAKKLNMAIKLLASSKRVGDTFSVLVAPMLLSEEHPLCNVNDVFNAVFVRSNMLGDAMFYGSGAGKLPTASAVVADVVDAAKHLHRNVVTRWDAGELELIPNAEAEHRFFVRVQGRSEAQKEQIREAFGSVEIVETEGLEDEFGFITEVMTEGTYSKKAEAFPEIIHMIRLAD